MTRNINSVLNEIIAGKEFSEKQISIIKKGLKHGLSIRGLVCIQTHSLMLTK